MAGTGTGAKTLGRYELISEVAKGQLGPLWAAHPTGEDKTPVLVRRVSTTAPTTPDEIDSLCEGAWWMLELSDPGLARGIDVVKTEGELGVVMEYAEGEVLRSLLRLASFKRRPIPVGVAVRVSLDVLEAIQSASNAAQPHSNGQSGFVAGGIVPDSVLVGRDGRARLLDIGVLGPASRVGTIARHPEMASYAAPEVLEDATKSDLRANLYGVGVMLWEMLSGKRMFVGSTHQAVVDKVKAGGIQRLDAQKPVGGDAISTSIADIVAKAIEVSADARYASPKELTEALLAAGEVATHEQVSALVEDFAGNTLAARKKLIEKAISGGGGSAKKEAPAPPARVPPPRDAAGTGDRRPPPPQRPPPSPGKATLIGIQPLPDAAKYLSESGSKPDAAAVLPPPRPPLESLDSEELESVSKVELLEFPSSEAPTKPNPDAGILAAQSAEPEHIKTQFLGTPAPDASDALAVAAAEPGSPGPPPAAGSPKPPDAVAAVPPPPAALTGSDDVPVSMDIDALQSEPHSPDNAAKGLDWAAIAAKAPEGEEAGAEKKDEKRDESAVAWVGPPPGTPLDDAPPGADAEIDEPIPSIVPERVQRMRKGVAIGIGGLVGLLLIGILISKLGGKDETAAAPTSTAAAVEPPKKEEPKAEEPKPKAEEPKAEEPKAEEPKAEEPKAEEPKAETPKPEPRPVVAKPTTKPVTVSKPTTTPKPTTKPKPKPKPKFTPSGI
ncbi:MAG: protein kinase [Myxococcales bacterium]|nr:protein kinase [Myxococcales bacterium]